MVAETYLRCIYEQTHPERREDYEPIRRIIDRPVTCWIEVRA